LKEVFEDCISSVQTNRVGEYQTQFLEVSLTIISLVEIDIPWKTEVNGMKVNAMS
jgi:hypothetical protein